MRQLMKLLTEFECDMIVERTQEGKSISKRQPDFKEGHPRLYGRKQIQHALNLLKDHSYRQVDRIDWYFKIHAYSRKNKAVRNV